MGASESPVQKYFLIQSLQPLSLFITFGDYIEDGINIPHIQGEYNMPDIGTTCYTAGLVDGEGTITLMRITRGKTRAPVVSISSTTYELVEFMKNTYGGHVIKLAHTNTKWKQAWHWQASYDRAIEVIQAIEPYLREPKKRYRAQLILDRYKSVTPRNGKYTPDLLEARRLFEEEFFADQPNHD